MANAIREPQEPARPLVVGMSLLSESPAQFTGTARYVNELLRQFARRGDDIGIDVVVDGRDGHRLAPGPNLRVHRSGRRLPGGSRLSRAATLAAAALRPARFSGGFPARVDVVHYPLTFAVPKVIEPTVLSFFDVQHHDLPENFTRAQQLWRRTMYDRAARAATEVVTISEHARTRIIEKAGVDPSRITSIHLGVDHERFRPGATPRDETLLAPFELPARFLLYPASLWPHKNHRRLLEAFAAAGDDELGLVLTGATFGRLGGLVADAERQGIAARVRHLGQVPDDALPALYRRATALVFPSLHEGFGIPPLEAMACGCPVAASREAALAEVAGDAVAALDPRDPSQMARVIDRLAGDPRLRERLRGNGLTWAARFTWERAADQHLDVYRRAMERRDG